jgi:hypothetical protein
MEPRIPGESLQEYQDTEGAMPGPPIINLRYLTNEGRAEDVERRRIQLLDELPERRGNAYENSLAQAERMKQRKPITDEDVAPEGYFYQIDDWVKVKNMSYVKFEFRWIGPFHVKRLGTHPRSYYLSDNMGKTMQHPVSEHNMAPWLAAVEPNENYSYYGRVDDTIQQEQTIDNMQDNNPRLLNEEEPAILTPSNDEAEWGNESEENRRLGEDPVMRYNARVATLRQEADEAETQDLRDYYNAQAERPPTRLTHQPRAGTQRRKFQSEKENYETFVMESKPRGDLLRSAFKSSNTNGFESMNNGSATLQKWDCSKGYNSIIEQSQCSINGITIDR